MRIDGSNMTEREERFDEGEPEAMGEAEPAQPMDERDSMEDIDAERPGSDDTPAPDQAASNEDAPAVEAETETFEERPVEPEPVEPEPEPVEPDPEPTVVEPVEPDVDLSAVEKVAAEVPDTPEPEAAETPEPAVVEERVPAADDPFRGPGEWYVVHTYSGYENKVREHLESRIHTMQMEDKIFGVHIPMEDVMEIKSGKKQVVKKKQFPGYLLVRMIYDNDSWYVVRNTPGVTGFVSAGTGTKPTPLSKHEVEKILAVKKEEVRPQVRLGFEEGDIVRITSGPFADFNGTINEINPDQAKLKVLVNIFDRETPVELSFDQVSKV
jgi:transcriptional antiterminator NusG